MSMTESFAFDAFRETYGHEPPILASAPGRVNLIGEHTDTSGGFVFPCAIDRRIAVAARPCGGASHWRSTSFGSVESLDVTTIEPGSVEGWARYPAGIAWAFRAQGIGDVPNLEAVVASDLPPETGLSSSAAICVAFATLWNRLCGFNLTPVEIAQLAQFAENNFVGVKCGIMDQLASACGREGEAIFLDTRLLQMRMAKVPEHLALVVCDTKSRRDLSSSAYNQRRDEVDRVTQLLGVSQLRDAQLDDLLERQEALDPVLIKRARHVITENTRCQGFYWALEDSNELRLGLLMRASHESLREDFEVTNAELDAMAEACWTAPGCVGARMTGAGFGGCCIALVYQHNLEAFRRSVSNRYASITGIEPNLFVCKPSDGARTRQ